MARADQSTQPTVGTPLTAGPPGRPHLHATLPARRTEPGPRGATTQPDAPRSGAYFCRRAILFSPATAIIVSHRRGFCPGGHQVFRQGCRAVSQGFAPCRGRLAEPVTVPVGDEPTEQFDLIGEAAKDGAVGTVTTGELPIQNWATCG